MKARSASEKDAARLKSAYGALADLGFSRENGENFRAFSDGLRNERSAREAQEATGEGPANPTRAPSGPAVTDAMHVPFSVTPPSSGVSEGFQNIPYQVPAQGNAAPGVSDAQLLPNHVPNTQNFGSLIDRDSFQNLHCTDAGPSGACPVSPGVANSRGRDQGGVMLP